MTTVLASIRPTFRSLANRNVRLFMIGQLISQSGTWMQRVAVIWVALTLSDSGLVLGLVVATQFLPVLIFGAAAGVVIDRMDRFRLMLGCQFAFMAVAIGFTVLMFAGRLDLVAIYVLSAAFGMIETLDNPTRKVFVTELADEGDLANAVGLSSALMTGSRTYGPTVAGILLTTVGAEWCFAVNSLTYIAVLFALLSIDRTKLRKSEKAPAARGQIREGIRWARGSLELRVPLVLVTAVGGTVFVFDVTLPLLAERTFGGDALTFTLLYAAMSVGNVVGALVVARRVEVTVGFLNRAIAVLTGSMIALSVAPHLWIAMLVAIPVGASALCVGAGSTVLVQLAAPPHVRGRLVALTTVLFIGSRPIGGIIVGWSAETFGARAGVLVGALACGGVGLWSWLAVRRGPPADHADLATAFDGASVGSESSNEEVAPGVGRVNRARSDRAPGRGRAAPRRSTTRPTQTPTVRPDTAR